MASPLHAAFVPNPSFDVQGTHLAHTLGLNTTAGDIGIEIECEGNKFPKHSSQIPSAWRYVHDGSLRGEDNAEYVLAKPLSFEHAENAVKDIYKCLADYGTVLDESNRTSVHVHLNVQRFYLNRLASFFGLYFMVEEILTEWCGDHRIGNLFCLRAKDAPAIVTKVKRFIQNDGRSELTEGLHYSGLNAHAMMKFGSLEIRSLRGVTDPTLVLDWVKVLERIYVLSGEYEDPRLVTENFSGNDPLDFLRNVLGESYDTVRNGIEFSDEQVRASMYEGIRLAQDICYCRDWSRYKPIDVSKNPFGRNKSASLEAAMSDIQSQFEIGGVTYASAPVPTATAFYNSLLSAGNNAGVIPTTSTYIHNPVTELEDYYEPEPSYNEDF